MSNSSFEESYDAIIDRIAKANSKIAECLAPYSASTRRETLLDAKSHLSEAGSLLIEARYGDKGTFVVNVDDIAEKKNPVEQPPLSQADVERILNQLDFIQGRLIYHGKVLHQIKGIVSQPCSCDSGRSMDAHPCDQQNLKESDTKTCSCCGHKDSP